MNNNIDLWSYFAGQALPPCINRNYSVDGAIKDCFEYADAMMEEWNKRQPKSEYELLRQDPSKCINKTFNSDAQEQRDGIANFGLKDITSR